MIQDRGLSVAGCAEPDLMGACRLTIKRYAKATQLLGDVAIAKA
jgi:hypothetical protein